MNIYKVVLLVLILSLPLSVPVLAVDCETELTLNGYSPVKTKCETNTKSIQSQTDSAIFKARKISRTSRVQDQVFGDQEQLINHVSESSSVRGEVRFGLTSEDEGKITNLAIGQGSRAKQSFNSLE